MGRTYWYGYDRSGAPSGPYYETKGEAADALGEDEFLRPIDGSVLPSDAEVVDESTDAEYTAVEESETVAERIDGGVCPWCDEYTGENVGQHASSAHPDEWSAFKNDD